MTHASIPPDAARALGHRRRPRPPVGRHRGRRRPDRGSRAGAARLEVEPARAAFAARGSDAYGVQAMRAGHRPLTARSATGRRAQEGSGSASSRSLGRWCRRPLVVRMRRTRCWCRQPAVQVGVPPSVPAVRACVHRASRRRTEQLTAGGAGALEAQPLPVAGALAGVAGRAGLHRPAHCSVPPAPAVAAASRRPSAPPRHRHAPLGRRRRSPRHLSRRCRNRVARPAAPPPVPASPPPCRPPPGWALLVPALPPPVPPRRHCRACGCDAAALAASACRAAAGAARCAARLSRPRPFRRCRHRPSRRCRGRALPPPVPAAPPPVPALAASAGASGGARGAAVAPAGAGSRFVVAAAAA